MNDPTIDELMAIAMSQQIRDGDFMSHGASVPLAAAAMMVAKQSHAPTMDFFYQGTISTRERDPAKLILDMAAIYAQAPAFFSQAGIIDFELRGGADIQFIRPAQIDSVGNVNTSVIGTIDSPKMRFHGIAVADAMCLVRRICLYTTEHSPRVFVEKLPFITGLGHPQADAWREKMDVPGGGPTTVITPLGILDFDTPDKRMRLRAVFEGVSVDEVRSKTGFELEVAGDVEVFTVSERDVERLREIDPLGTRKMEFKSMRVDARRRLEAHRVQLDRSDAT